MLLSVANVEQAVFHDKKLQGKLPQHAPLFKQWAWGYQNPAMRHLCRRSALDLLDRLTPDDVATIAAHVGEPVEVKKLNTRLVDGLAADPDTLGEQLAAKGLIGWNLAIHRSKDSVDVTAWR